jgi:RNA recognition motif-containing protein
MTKLYVGNLPFTVTEEAVRNLFAPHGTVEKISLINDRETGRPRGFGFVEMSNSDASRAMQALNGPGPRRPRAQDQRSAGTAAHGRIPLLIHRGRRLTTREKLMQIQNQAMLRWNFQFEIRTGAGSRARALEFQDPDRQRGHALRGHAEAHVARSRILHDLHRVLGAPRSSRPSWIFHRRWRCSISSCPT